ncbi:MAG: PLP-dependent aminotransferase family protein [Natronospirillum sp.]|uniref:MocR-like pyridoxine biosynthesis transcription factor PdxR n=1 Tax=Natronospirillum sp. TaxID=2812955 RepID=UPI0025E084C9|nr:PLP-dependent aminotransferase family protein [Natronospirillum sp.]MCH8552477.1 PLP-dependent aminotransferase family protein [Natronospirillum sp.]
MTSQKNRHNAASLSISLEPEASRPAHRQIRDQLVALIESGRLGAGARLPSSRHLAQELGVSRMTTQTALDNLLAEGYVVSEPRRGIFVADHLPLATPPSDAHQKSPVTQESATTEWLHFASGASVADFPNQAWRRCLRESWLNPSPALMEGTLPSGYRPLRSAIADMLYALRGLRCGPEQILITAGNRDALTLVMSTLRRLHPARSGVWLENPCFPPILNGLRDMGLRPEPLPVDNEGAKLPEKETEPGALAALVTPARQYPLGRVMSTRRRQQWLDLVQTRAGSGQPLWLIEDDYDSEFVYEGRPQAPLSAADDTGHCILLGSFSKSLFKSLRLGYIVAPPALHGPLLDTQRTLGQAAALPLQPALHHFISSGEFAGHLRRMRRLYLERRNHLLDGLRQAGLPLTPWPCHSGMHLIAEIDADQSGLADQQWAQRAQRRKLRLDTISRHYWQGKPTHQGFLLGFSAHDTDQQAAALELLSQLA